MKICVTLAAALLLGRAFPAHACPIGYTTIPDSSGFVTCQGQNADGTTATWTVGGSITYTKGGSQYQHLGYFTFGPCPDGNPNIFLEGFEGQPCEARVYTSTDIKPDCPAITGELYLAYDKYGASGRQTLSCATYAIENPQPNVQNPPYQVTGNFDWLTDVKDVQYKVMSTQPLVANSPKWTAATPYL